MGDFWARKENLMKKENNAKKTKQEKPIPSKEFQAALKEIKREGQAPLTVVDADKDFPKQNRHL